MKIAVVCADGIGDALILHTASAQLKERGFEVVTFTNHRFPKGWQGYSFADQKEVELLGGFDAIFLEHDNTPKARYIRATFPQVYSLFGAYVESKHGPLREGLDWVCDRNLTLLDNVMLAVERFFGGSPTKDNGLKVAPHLTYRRFPKRVVLHTTSGDVEKNWPEAKFRQLALLLEKGGFEPVFLGRLPTLDDVAELLYESGFFIGNDSGPGHLASCLGIPTLTLNAIRLWHPGWGPGLVVPPPKLLSRHWKTLLQPKKVWAQFQNLVKSFHKGDPP